MVTVAQTLNTFLGSGLDPKTYKHINHTRFLNIAKRCLDLQLDLKYAKKNLARSYQNTLNRLKDSDKDLAIEELLMSQLITLLAEKPTAFKIQKMRAITEALDGISSGREIATVFKEVSEKYKNWLGNQVMPKVFKKSRTWRIYHAILNCGKASIIGTADSVNRIPYPKHTSARPAGTVVTDTELANIVKSSQGGSAPTAPTGQTASRTAISSDFVKVHLAYASPNVVPPAMPAATPAQAVGAYRTEQRAAGSIPQSDLAKSHG